MRLLPISVYLETSGISWCVLWILMPLPFLLRLFRQHTYRLSFRKIGTISPFQVEHKKIQAILWELSDTLEFSLEPVILWEEIGSRKSANQFCFSFSPSQRQEGRLILRLRNLHPLTRENEGTWMCSDVCLLCHRSAKDVQHIVHVQCNWTLGPNCTGPTLHRTSP